eukprot:4609155-Ditylum_brightwellii.AAC.1
MDESSVNGLEGNGGDSVNVKDISSVSNDGSGGMGTAFLAGVIACSVTVLLLVGLIIKYRRDANKSNFIARKKRKYDRKRSPR